jgi:hypothetical protein
VAPAGIAPLRAGSDDLQPTSVAATSAGTEKAMRRNITGRAMTV